MKNFSFVMVLMILCFGSTSSFAQKILKPGIYRSTETADNCHKIESSGDYANWRIKMYYGYTCADYRFTMTIRCQGSECRQEGINGVSVSGRDVYWTIAPSGLAFTYAVTQSTFVLDGATQEPAGDAGKILLSGQYYNRDANDNCHKIEASGTYVSWYVTMRYGYSCGDYPFYMTWKCERSVCKQATINGTPVYSDTLYFVSQDGREFSYMGSGSTFIYFSP